MSDRALTSGVSTAIDAGVIRPVLFVELEYDDSGVPAWLRLFTGVGQLNWDGHTWTGGRDALSISPIRESTNIEAIGFSVTISGLPAEKLSIALQSMRKNKQGKLWLGFFDTTNTLIPDPYPLRRGRFDMVSIPRDVAAGTMTIQVNYEGPLARLLVANERRYTHEDQQLRGVFDLGFDQVPELQDAVDIWGGPVPTGPPAWPIRGGAPSDGSGGD
jgi:hypothetical protein